MSVIEIPWDHAAREHALAKAHREYVAPEQNMSFIDGFRAGWDARTKIVNDTIDAWNRASGILPDRQGKPAPDEA